MGFFGNIQEKTQQLKEKTQNSRQKLKVSAKSKTRFAENASKKKPALKRLIDFSIFIEQDSLCSPTGYLHIFFSKLLPYSLLGFNVGLLK